ncbi:response regulator transcription factor [Prevotella sp. KH2C16]|uniref:response regulator transcription factor n=1 Tax=Prevotella sp. KH2C16 TaxID=1855325 RepID=UPI0008EEDCBC|nr:response regulator transcription factor [Prevotella sp. KH2C16]SFG41341.1 DNA-binding response regulator, NarL/FixJ family, contains REC and HTH domains [Prevotella sp. KH2C16]
MHITIADKQDITRAGLVYLLGRKGWNRHFQADNKAGLTSLMKAHGDMLVILDYTLFDLNGTDELLILHDRFPHSFWIIFSDDLSAEFIRTLMTAHSRFSILSKDSSLREIEECIGLGMRRQRFVAPQISTLLLAPAAEISREKSPLTPTETEILKDIALGLTTKEIAEKRFSSFHTVNTHRKNIFRKLQVNNAYEATKYAFRSGLVDSAEYYI